MGQGEEVKTREEPNVRIQERGEIFFFYRPKIDKQEAHSSDDVQRMYIILRPESGESSDIEVKQDPKSGKKSASSGQEGGQGEEQVNIKENMLLRLIVMGKKSLPDPTKNKRGRPFWGFVELVTTKLEDVKVALKGEEYDTATRGHRKNSPARAFGEGVYRILKHQAGNKKMHTHLIYKLEFPGEDEKNEVQESLNVKREGSFLIQIKNPEKKGGAGGGFGGLQKKRKAVFPAHLQGEFGKLGYHAADPPDFLNYEGCELLLIAASDDIEGELGLDLKTETDWNAEEERKGSDDEEGEECESCSDLVKTFGEGVSTRPLFQGTWA